jgi:hypothetical protein
LIKDLEEMKKKFDGDSNLYKKSADIVIRTVWGKEGV